MSFFLLIPAKVSVKNATVGCDLQRKVPIATYPGLAQKDLRSPTVHTDKHG